MAKPLVALITNHDDDVYCFRKELIESLVANGYDVLVSCPYGEKLELMREINFIHDDVWIDRRGINPVSDMKLIFYYRRLFKKYKPDIILTYTIKPNIYASFVAMSLKIPYINNITGLGSVLKMKKSLQKFILCLFKIAFKKSSCIFFQNEENMHLALKQGLVNKNYRLIPGSGVNTKRFPLQDYPNGGNGIIGDTVVFNYIGRVLHDKGIDDYLEAAKIIKEKYPRTEFNIIGFIEPSEKHYKEKLEKLQNQNIVIYRGQQKDVIPFITKSHAIIHPSTYGEGMSNVLLENASSGRVLITTDNPGCQETVKNQETGFIYQGGNVEKLVSCITLFLSIDNKSRKQMGINGRNKVIKEFSRDIVVKAYLKEIKDLVIVNGK